MRTLWEPGQLTYNEDVNNKFLLCTGTFFKAVCELSCASGIFLRNS